MNPLHELLDMATDPSIRTTDALRKCQVLAHRIKYEPLKRWTQLELNGYSSTDALPSYRTFTNLQVKGDFDNLFGAYKRDAVIPLYGRDQERYARVDLRDSITEYEILLLNVQQQENKTILRPVSTGVAKDVSKSLYPGMICRQAWVVIPNQKLAGVVEVVRNRMLAFCLELDDQFPDAGDLQALTTTQERVVNQVFTTHIWGGVNNIASGSSEFKQIANGPGEMTPESLRRSLLEVGVPERDADELSRVVVTEKPNSETGRLGPKVSEWLSRAFTEIAMGSWDISMRTGGEVIPKIIGSYYGVDF